MYYFCTYFDRNYVPRALVMYDSLLQHCRSFRLFALCMDPEAYMMIQNLNLSHLTPIQLSQIEETDQDLLSAKRNRSRVEYFYTVGPAFIRHVMYAYPEIDLINYLDADVYFFSDPSPVLEEMLGQSVGIIEHRFPDRLQKLTKYGTYNVGWVSFRRDDAGLACLSWWREQCIKWCHDRVENGRFADQKYLDEFPVRFNRVRNIKHKGANLAPWNLASHKITTRDEKVFVDDQPLIFFHFHGLRMVAPWLFDSNVGLYNTKLSPLVRCTIFRPYIRRLISRHMGNAIAGNPRELGRDYGSITRVARNMLRHCRALLTRAYIIDLSAQLP